MKSLALFSLVLFISATSSANSGALAGDQANIALNNTAAGATSDALEELRAQCQELEQRLSQEPQNQSLRQQRDDICRRAQEAAAQVGNLGSGMSEALQALSALAQTAAAFAGEGGGDTGFGTDGYIDDPYKATSSLTQAGLSAQDANRYVRDNQAAEKALSELGGPPSVGSGGGSGLGGSQAAISGSSGSFGGNGAPPSDEKPPAADGQALKDPNALKTNVGSAEASGGGGSSAGEAPPAFPPLTEFQLAKPKDLKKKNAPTAFTNLGQDKIGTTSTNIFENLSRRYQFHKMSNGFILDQ